MNSEIHELNISELDAVIGGSIFGTPGGPGPGTGPYAPPTGPITIQVPTGPGTTKHIPLFPA
jgi:hypothetical protein